MKFTSFHLNEFKVKNSFHFILYDQPDDLKTIKINIYYILSFLHVIKILFHTIFFIYSYTQSLIIQ